MTPLRPKLVCGGQTGADRGALDAARAVGLEYGGWCPRHRRAEGGRIPDRYPLRETPLRDYRQRTAWNVRDADLTLILSPRPLWGGTRLTARIAAERGKPITTVNPFAADAVARIRREIAQQRPRVLNVAGPRERQRPGIEARVRTVLSDALTRPPARAPRQR